jgi:hypothetical protein
MTALQKYEIALEKRGSVKLSRKQAEVVFDARARKLVKMSGKRALKRIRKGKCGPDLAWSELTLFATAMR